MISFDLLSDLNFKICNILKEKKLNYLIENVNECFKQTQEKAKIQNSFKATNKSFFLSGESIDSSDSCLNTLKKIMTEGHFSKTLKENREELDHREVKSESSKKVTKNLSGMVEKITKIPFKNNKGDSKVNTEQRLPIFKVTFTNVKTQVTDSVFSDGSSLLMSGIKGYNSKKKIVHVDKEWPKMARSHLKLLNEIGYKVRKYSKQNETFKTKITYDSKNIRLQLLYKRSTKTKDSKWVELSNLKDKLLKPLQPLMEAEKNIIYKL